MNALSLSDFCHGAAQFGLALFLQSGLILLLGLSLSAWLRRRGPQAQSLAYRAILLAVVFTGLTSIVGASDTRPLWRVTLPSASGPAAVHEAPAALPMAQPGPAPVTVTTPKAPPVSSTDTIPPPTPAFVAGVPPAPPSERPLLPWTARFYVALVGVWGLGTTALLLWLLAGQTYLLALRRRSVPVSTGPAADILNDLCAKRALRPIPILASPHIRSPFLAGLWRPVIFLPASDAADFDDASLRAILAHELAHRERRDNHWMLLTRLLGAVLWFQPLCWLLARRMEQTSEEACDALALTSAASPREYADCLLSLAQRLAPSRLQRTLGAGVMPSRSALGRRIRRILQKEAPVMSPLPFRLRFAVILGVLFSATSGLVFVSGNTTSAQQSNGGGLLPDKGAAECEAHLQAITRAITRYAQDHQGHLPDSATWTNEIMPYVTDASVFHDPDASPTQKWSYAYNQYLSGASIGQLHSPAQTVVVYDSERNYVLDPVEGIRNASNPGDALPRPGRHNGFNVFGFLDGHTEVLPTGQKPSFKVSTDHPTPARRAPSGNYTDTLALRAEKARQDWLSFKQTHPVTLSQVQIAQINRLINLRLQRNGLDDGIRINAVIRAKHMARLEGLGPGQEAERRKWQTQIKILDAQTLQWEAQMPRIGQQISQQEALVQPFADDYLETQYKQQQYDIIRNIRSVIVQTDASARQRQLDDAKKRLAASQQEMKSYPMPPGVPAAPPFHSSARFLAGLTAVQGPGVIVTLTDGKHAAPGKAAPAAILPYLIHDTDINQVVNELRAAGAEAIAINDQRLIATSSIRAAGPAVMVNNIPQPSPYVIRAIGNPRSLAYALSLPGGVKDELKRLDPAMMQIKQAATITLPAYRGSTIERYAKPIFTTSKENEQAKEAVQQAQIKEAVRKAKMAALLKEQSRVEAQLAGHEAELNIMRSRLQANPISSKPSVPNFNRLHSHNPEVYTRAEADFVRSVHQHNLQVIRYWNIVARKQELMRRIKADGLMLEMLHNQIQKMQRTH